MDATTKAGFFCLMYLCLSAVQVFSDSNYCTNPQNYYNNYVGQDAIPNPDVPLAMLQQKLASATTEEENNKIKAELNTIIQARCNLDKIIEDIESNITGNDEEKKKTLRNTEIDISSTGKCSKSTIKEFSRLCHHPESDQPYAMSNFAIFHKLCNARFTNVKSIKRAIKKSCAN